MGFKHITQLTSMGSQLCYKVVFCLNEAQAGTSERQTKSFITLCETSIQVQ